MRLLPKFDLGVYRVIRGAYALNTTSAIRPTLHTRIVPYSRDYDIGFRICRGVR